jgi:nucleotide-binding universal stress UspA family protein
MDHLRDILVPTDLSLASRAAALAAIALAKRYDDARLTFLHVSEPAPAIATDVLVEVGAGRRMAFQDFVRERATAL